MIEITTKSSTSVNPVARRMADCMDDPIRINRCPNDWTIHRTPTKRQCTGHSPVVDVRKYPRASIGCQGIPAEKWQLLGRVLAAVSPSAAR